MCSTPSTSDGTSEGASEGNTSISERLAVTGKGGSSVGAKGTGLGRASVRDWSVAGKEYRPTQFQNTYRDFQDTKNWIKNNNSTN